MVALIPFLIGMLAGTALNPCAIRSTALRREMRRVDGQMGKIICVLAILEQLVDPLAQVALQQRPVLVLLNRYAIIARDPPLAPRRTRAAASARGSRETAPRRRLSRRLRLACAEHRAERSRLQSRKSRSPRFAKISGISCPSRFNDLGVHSHAGHARRSANSLPTVDLPVPMKPTSTIFRCFPYRSLTDTFLICVLHARHVS